MNTAALISLAADAVAWLIEAWRDHEDDTKSRIAQAMAAATAGLTQLALTEPVAIGSRSFEIKARGMVNVQLAPIVDDIDHLPLELAIAKEAAVLSARALFERRM